MAYLSVLHSAISWFKYGFTENKHTRKCEIESSHSGRNKLSLLRCCVLSTRNQHFRQA